MKIEKHEHYTEITLSSIEKVYYELLMLYFKPKDALGDYFEKIFPKDIVYQENHKGIAESIDFLEWNGWLFRGQQDSNWTLKTSFERLVHNKPIKKDFFELEMGMIRDFRRKIKEFAPQLVSLQEDDYYEGLANMQHYGCSTRFLDVTFSFFTAMYFAISHIDFASANEKDGKKSFAIWCFNRMWIEKEYKNHLPKDIQCMYQNIDPFGKDVRIQKEVLNHVPTVKEQHGDYANECLAVINMTPYYLNKRLIHQKGSFLMPTNPYVPFEQNLFSMVKNGTDDIFRILKITVPYNNKSLTYMLKFLDEMNNNGNVLFDSAEGMCESINFKTRLPNDALVVPQNKGMR